MPKVKRADRIWLAGLFDGEGCIILHPERKTGYHQCRLVVTNTDSGILNEVRRIYDEWLIFYTTCRVSSLGKPCFHIEVNRQLEAKFVLKQILPYLKSIKKEKAKQFIFFIDNHVRKDGRRLNRKAKVI